MQQILENHPLLASSSCSLSSVHTIPTPTLERLLYVLEDIFPQFAEQGLHSASPVKLLIIDALAELFHTSSKTSTCTLVERSKGIAEIAHRLHAAANKYSIAVVVLNEVVDVIERGMSHEPGELSYSEQSRWFSRADTLPGENLKEATLGLTWANQINARIFLTRTGRRRYLEGLPGQTSGGIMKSSTTAEDEPTLIRRLSVVFSSVSLQASCDYLVTIAGVSVVPGSFQALKPPLNGIPSPKALTSEQTTLRADIGPHLPQQQELAPLDVGLMTANEDNLEASAGQANDSDEWDEYLGEWEFHDLPPSLYEGS
ncbi:hypothetical protein CONPUDRAFT_118007 [Coniophora puteana RWD-64-598 SS2]|uniref:Uncharacterized protein n=1 Tax=Coniophora puteana (strain RWD-64-598) TaxID=741705 RepID=A0A5M3N1K1_CONPW|nr:uncharacterized protein CONPUDRAFT_118007 [Coniophora puteana RWD-64-598 SS2]EIW85272.1 hypothetical protein CONPUDRAFT_118007 [Coniophora puteana RWD-64-598 SS2]